jgi:hypothetical protein
MSHLQSNQINKITIPSTLFMGKCDGSRNGFSFKGIRAWGWH